MYNCGFLVVILGAIVTYIGGQVLLAGSSGRSFHLDVGLKYGSPILIVGMIIVITGLMLKKREK